MSLTRLQQSALLILRTRLNPRDPHISSQCTKDIQQHLLAIEPWLTSWVLPAVDAIEPNAPRWLRESIENDAGDIALRKAGAK